MDNNEINRLIAENLMGWQDHSETSNPIWFSKDGTEYVDFTPSTNIKDAWLVVEFLRKENFPVDMKIEMDAFVYVCNFYSYGLNIGTSTSNSIEKSICLAALQTVR
jgi:hypothetical protein